MCKNICKAKPFEILGPLRHLESQYPNIENRSKNDIVIAGQSLINIRFSATYIQYNTVTKKMSPDYLGPGEIILDSFLHSLMMRH